LTPLPSDPRPRSITTDDSLLKNLYAFNFVSDGIPSAFQTPLSVFVPYLTVALRSPVWYYGEEQNANGGSDPYNREALWTLGASPYDVSEECSLPSDCALADELASQTTAAYYQYAKRLNAIRRAAYVLASPVASRKLLQADHSTLATVQRPRPPSTPTRPSSTRLRSPRLWSSKSSRCSRSSTIGGRARPPTRSPTW
jgi:hypothetical protein